MIKKIRLIIILLVIFILVVTIGLIINKNKNNDKHKTLTEKFYVPIKNSYNIIQFKNVTGDYSERCCYSEIKISEKDYNNFELEIKKSGYVKEPLEWYDIFIENNSDWISNENIIAVYTKHIVETQYIIKRNRIQINIFITESEDGYRQIYMLRN